MRNALFAAAASVALFGSAGLSLGTVIYQTGFEAPGYALGSLIGQNNWAQFDGDSPFPTVTVQNTVVRPITGGLQAVQFQANGPSADPFADFTDVWTYDSYVSPAQIAAEPLVHIQFDMMRGPLGIDDTATGAWGVDIYDSNDNFIAGTVVAYDDPGGPAVAGTDDNGDLIFLGDGTARGTWNTYAIDLDYVSRTYTVSLDGNVLGGALALNASADSGIGDVDFLSWTRGTDSAYFDNLLITTSPVPEPSLLAIAIVPATMALRRRTRRF